jgi:hypothetical protein
MSCTNFKDVIKGDSFGVKDISIKNGTTSIDLTGVLIKCQFRQKIKNGVLVKEISEATGIDIYDAVNGLFRVDDFLVNWDSDIYYYDFQFTFTDGKVKTYFGGFFKVIQDVTQNS